MEARTLAVIKAALDADTVLSRWDKDKILAVCRNPRQFPRPPAETIPHLLTIKEVMDILKVSRSTVWRLTTDGLLRRVEYCRNSSARYLLSDINALIEARAKGENPLYYYNGKAVSEFSEP